MHHQVLPDWQRLENLHMKPERSPNEWKFGRVTEHFKYVDQKKRLKILEKTTVGFDIVNSFLLDNVDWIQWIGD